MIKLPALSAEERAWIASGLPDDAVRVLAERICLHLQATFGIRMLIVGNHAVQLIEPFTDSEPQIKIDAALASAWLDLRYGGKLTGYVGSSHDPAWNIPLIELVRRALAETVINHSAINRSDSVRWPQAMRIQLQAGSLVGTINILWNNEQACRWSRQYIGAATENSAVRSARA